MQGWDAGMFGPLNAQNYDTTSDPGNHGSDIARLTELCEGRRVLEFAVGTGRIALPLAEAGIDVSGIELSPEMIAELRKRPGGEDLHVVQGDMSDTQVPGEFDTVLLVFNTLFNVTSQSGQKAVFRNAARHLRAGGQFLVEAFVPDFGAFQDGQRVRIRSMGLDHLALDAIQVDPAAQTVSHQRLWTRNGRTELVPLVLRYAYPAELDLMAELAGFELVSRWSGWSKEPFGPHSRKHVSIWEKRA